MSRFLWSLLAVVPLLAAGNCNPSPPPSPPPETCSLSCPLGQKTDITGTTYCECRTETCPTERPSPFVNPATGVCTGFPTDCDIPSGWTVCPRCQPDDCGPHPGVPNRVCSDDTLAGATCSLHEDGDCTWSILGCPEDGEQCNDAFCPAGSGCCNWSCSVCAPTGGSCTQEVCASTN